MPPASRHAVSPIAPRAARLPACFLRALLAALLLLAACVLPARRACAQGEVGIEWTACDSLGNPDQPVACSVNEGESRLVLSLRPDGTVTQVVGWSLVLDVAVGVDTLPAWWQLQPGGCRQGQVSAVFPDGSEGGNCTDLWSATGSALLQSVIYPRPGGGINQFRMIVGVSVPVTNAFTIPGGQSCLAAVLGLHFANTIGAFACPGCLTPACIVLNSAEIERVPGAPGAASVLCWTPLPKYGNRATWGGGTNCDAVPVRNRSWGSLKALYR